MFFSSTDETLKQSLLRKPLNFDRQDNVLLERKLDEEKYNSQCKPKLINTTTVTTITTKTTTTIIIIIIIIIEKNKQVAIIIAMTLNKIQKWYNKTSK